MISNGHTRTQKIAYTLTYVFVCVYVKKWTMENCLTNNDLKTKLLQFCRSLLLLLNYCYYFEGVCDFSQNNKNKMLWLTIWHIRIFKWKNKWKVLSSFFIYFHIYVKWRYVFYTMSNNKELFLYVTKQENKSFFVVRRALVQYIYTFFIIYVSDNFHISLTLLHYITNFFQESSK